MIVKPAKVMTQVSFDRGIELAHMSFTAAHNFVSVVMPKPPPGVQKFNEWYQVEGKDIVLGKHTKKARAAMTEINLGDHDDAAVDLCDVQDDGDDLEEDDLIGKAFDPAASDAQALRVVKTIERRNAVKSSP